MAEDSSADEWRARVEAPPAAVIAAANAVGFAHVATDDDDVATLTRGDEQLRLRTAPNEATTVAYRGPNQVPAHQLARALASAGAFEVTATPSPITPDDVAARPSASAEYDDVPQSEGIDGAVVLFTGDLSAEPPKGSSHASGSAAVAREPAVTAPPTANTMASATEEPTRTDSSRRRGRVVAIAVGLCGVAVVLVVLARLSSRPGSSLDTASGGPTIELSDASSRSSASVGSPSGGGPTASAEQTSTTVIVTITQVPPTTSAVTTTQQPTTTQPTTTATTTLTFVHRVTAHELSVRTAPSVSASEARPDLHTGDIVTIVCQGKGGLIPADTGADGDPNLWDQLDDGFWVADIYVDTNKPYGRDPNADPWRDPAIPRC